MVDIFSEAETKVLKILGKKTMTIVDITDAFYVDQEAPIGPNNTIGATIRRINEKCEYHKLNWFLNGMGAGRAGREIWKDKR